MSLPWAVKVVFSTTQSLSSKVLIFTRTVLFRKMFLTLRLVIRMSCALNMLSRPYELASREMNEATCWRVHFLCGCSSGGPDLHSAAWLRVATRFLRHSSGWSQSSAIPLWWPSEPGLLLRRRSRQSAEWSATTLGGWCRWSARSSGWSPSARHFGRRPSGTGSFSSWCRQTTRRWTNSSSRSRELALRCSPGSSWKASTSLFSSTPCPPALSSCLIRSTPSPPSSKCSRSPAPASMTAPTRSQSRILPNHNQPHLLFLRNTIFSSAGYL